MQSLSSRLEALKLMDTSKTNSEYFFGALPCSSERQSELLNNLGRALWKLNNSLQHDEVSSQLGVPLVDSLLDSSIAWQAGGGKQSWGDEYVSVRGGSSRPHSAYFNYISHRLSEKRINTVCPFCFRRVSIHHTQHATAIQLL